MTDFYIDLLDSVSTLPRFHEYVKNVDHALKVITNGKGVLNIFDWLNGEINGVALHRYGGSPCNIVRWNGYKINQVLLNPIMATEIEESGVYIWNYDDIDWILINKFECKIGTVFLQEILTAFNQNPDHIYNLFKNILEANT